MGLVLWFPGSAPAQRVRWAHVEAAARELVNVLDGALNDLDTLTELALAQRAGEPNAQTVGRVAQGILDAGAAASEVIAPLAAAGTCLDLAAELLGYDDRTTPLLGALMEAGRSAKASKPERALALEAFAAAASRLGRPRTTRA